MTPRSSLWLALLAVLVALGAVFWLLLDGEPARDDGATGLAPRALDEPPPAAPVDPLAARPEAERLAPAPRAAPPADEPAPAPATRTLRGRVLRLADRSPLAGWRLRLPRAVTSTGGSMDGPAVPSTRLDDDGAFELPTDRAVLDELVVEPDAPGSGRSVRLPLPAELPDAPLELLADTGWILEGVVRSDRGGTPDGAVLQLPRHDPVEPGPDGRFRALDVLPNDPAIGALVVQVRAELHGIVQQELLLDRARRVVRGLEFVLPAAGALEGRLVGPDGVAHPYTRVSLMARLHDDDVELVHPRPRSSPPPHPYFAREAGRAPGERPGAEALEADALPVHYRIDSIPPGRYVLRVETPERTGLEGVELTPAFEASAGDADADLLLPPELWVDEVLVRAGAVTRLDLALPAGAGITGRVVDASGAGLPDVPVVALFHRSWELPGVEASFSTTNSGELVMEKVSDPEGGGRESLSLPLDQARTDADGAFRLGRLPPGPLLLRVERPGSKAVEQTLDLRAGSVLRGLEIELGGGLRVEGRVVSPTGQPVEGAWVSLSEPGGHVFGARDQQVDTDAEGRFLLSGLDARSYRLDFGAHGWLAGHREVRPGERLPDLVLQPAPFLRGRVVHAETGEPVRRFDFRTETESHVRSTTLADAEGRFEEPAMDASPVRLVIDAPGFAPWSREEVRPSHDPGVQLEVRLVPVQPGGG